MSWFKGVSIGTYCPFCEVTEVDPTAILGKDSVWECQKCHLRWKDVYKRNKNIHVFQGNEDVLSPRTFNGKQFYFYQAYESQAKAKKARSFLESIEKQDIKGNPLIYDVKIIKLKSGKYVVYKRYHKENE